MLFILKMYPCCCIQLYVYIYKIVYTTHLDTFHLWSRDGIQRTISSRHFGYAKRKMTDDGTIHTFTFSIYMCVLYRVESKSVSAYIMHNFVAGLRRLPSVWTHHSFAYIYAPVYCQLAVMQNIECTSLY